MCGLLLEEKRVNLLQLTGETVRGKFSDMDYLEGVLLGPVWSDTDYENRSHKGAALLSSVAFWLAFVYLLLQFYSDTLSPLLQTPTIWLGIFIGGLLITPILSYYYYDLPFIVRIIVLAIQAAKYLAAILLIYSLIVPAISLNFETLLPDALEWMDSTVGTFVERNTEVYELFGLLVSGIVIVLLGALAVILLLLAIVFAPIVLLQAIKYIQRLFDVLFLSLMREIRHIIARRRSNEQLRQEHVLVNRQSVESEAMNNREETGKPSIRAVTNPRESDDRNPNRGNQTNPPGTR